MSQFYLCAFWVDFRSKMWLWVRSYNKYFQCLRHTTIQFYRQMPTEQSTKMSLINVQHSLLIKVTCIAFVVMVPANLLAMFHSRAGFWELLSLSAETPPLVPSFSGLSCSHRAVPMLIDWRSIWYWRSSTSEPGSRKMPRLNARLQGEREKMPKSLKHTFRGLDIQNVNIEENK